MAQTHALSKPVKGKKMARIKATPIRSKNKTKATKPLKALPLSKDLLLKMHRLMLKSRALEERLIKIYKSGEAFFWIGGPGEEAFGVPLGLLTKKGHGPNHDFLHLHYRGTPTLIAMGMEMIDSIRIIMNRATDTSTGGRNFSNHYCFPQWNVTPVSSPIEVQYSFALGTARAQKRRKTDSLSIVTGGDAGSAEGDFASCLIWASRPNEELPILITVQNNQWGISTDYKSQHAETNVADRAKAFKIRSKVINGNDPIESYMELKSEMDYIRKNRKPVVLEAKVSRLYGHSSASGANPIPEPDCIRNFEELLFRQGVLKETDAKKIFAEYELEAREAQEKVRLEPAPSADSIWDHVYANNENGDWRKY